MNNIQMIFGSPGCGKTTYLIRLLETLLQMYSPREIAFVSFTRKGSYEGRDRAIERFGYSEKEFPYFRTIHSIAFRELEVSKYDIISKRHYKEFSRALGMNFVGFYTEDFTNNDDKFLFYYGLKRNNKKAFDKAYMDLDQNVYDMVEKNFIRYKHEMDIFDFNDLLINYIKRGEGLPIKIAIIDEAQDLTALQWAFCELAFRGCEKIYIAGDDDQSIYEWSGADIQKFLALGKEDSKKIILEKTYRLKKNILDFSKNILTGVQNRVDKFVTHIEEGGQVQFFNRIEDIPINNEETYYFLSRNNYFLNSYKKYLRALGIVFEYKNKPSVDKAKFKAIRTYEYLRKYNPEEINTNPGITMLLKKDADITEPWYNAFELDLDESNYYRDLIKNKTNIDKCNITVSTIHGVKGGECDNVVLKLDVTKNVSSNIDYNTDSELRCLYVAVTRAKKNLFIIHSNSKFSYERLLL